MVGWFPSAAIFGDSAAFALARLPRQAGIATSTFDVTVEDVAPGGDVAAVHDVWRETRHFRGSAVTVRRLIRGSELWRCQAGGVWRIVRWVSAPEPWERGTWERDD